MSLGDAFYKEKRKRKL